MKKSKTSKTHIKKERNRKKIERVIKKKGYKSGKLPKNKELHHIKTISKGGKTTSKNTRIVKRSKHKKIHKNRRKKGRI